MLPKNPKLKIFLLTLIAGVLMGVSFPPINLFFCSFFGIAVIIFLTLDSVNYRQFFLRNYLVFTFYQFISISWLSLSGLQKDADLFLVLGGFITMIVHSLFLMIPALIFFFLSRNIRIKNFPLFHLLLFPFIWTAFEYFHSLGEVSFPWLTIGNAFTTQLHKIQFIEYTGVLGISFWVCTISVMIYYLFLEYKKQKCEGGFCIFGKRKTFLIYILIFIIYFAPDLYTVLADSKNEFTNYRKEGTLKAGIIQPNINPWIKWKENSRVLTEDYAQLIRDISLKNNNLDIIIFPEAAVTYYILDPMNESKYDVLKNLIDSIKTPVLMGAPDLSIYTDTLNAPADAPKYNSKYRYSSFNSAILLEKEKNKSELQKYNKIKLVAASERMPHQDKLKFLKNIIKWSVGISSYEIGKDTTIFNLNNKFTFNTAICYESIYPEFFSEFVKKGADFCVVITNDGWWGKLFGTYQHNQYSVLRAIENRRWIVRCANTGISCYIDPYGNMLQKTEINERALITEDIGIRKQQTFYTGYGDLTGVSCMYFTVILIVAGYSAKIVRRFRKK
ncbi:MAG TPA: apolipoprotein N-acyltransferase [Ignavibacteria bacterium]